MTRFSTKTAAGLAIAALLAASLPALAADAPTVAITGGPEDGSTVSSGDVTFEFDTGDASSTECSIDTTGAESPAMFSCASPQSYSLPDGSYTFAVEAANDAGTTTASRAFTIMSASSTGSTTDEGGGSEEAATTTPVITITSGPDEGATTSGDVTFEFTAPFASSTMCDLEGAGATTTSFYACGSPQSFSLPTGSYVFTVQAGNQFGTTTASRAFNADASLDTGGGDTGDEDTGTTVVHHRSSGGGGGFQEYHGPVVIQNPAYVSDRDNGSSDVADAGTTGEGGSGDLSDFPVVITPVASAAGAGSSGSAAAGAGASGGSLASAAGAGGTGTVGGSVTIDENAVTTASATPATTDDLNGTATTINPSAAAAASGVSFPAWAWFVLALVLLAALLYWAYRASVSYDTR